MIDDPTPETPFLRSDCHGSCAGVGFDAIAGAAGHGHSHAHSRHQRQSSRQRSTTPMNARRSDRLAEQWANDEAGVGRATPPRHSIAVAPDRINSIDVDKIKRAVDLDDPTRTDYTYSHSDSYVRPSSSMSRPQWEIPKLSRVALRRSERHADSADYSDYGSDASFADAGCCARALSWIASFVRPSPSRDSTLHNGGPTFTPTTPTATSRLASTSYSFAATVVSVITTAIYYTTVYPAQKALSAVHRPARRANSRCCCVALPLFLLLAALVALAMHRAIYGKAETEQLVTAASRNIAGAGYSALGTVKESAGAASSWIAASWPVFYWPSSKPAKFTPPPAGNVDLEPVYKAINELEARLAAVERVDNSQYVSQPQLAQAGFAQSQDVQSLSGRLAALAAALDALQLGSNAPSDSVELTGVVNMELADMKESVSALRADVNGATARLDALSDGQMEQQTSTADLRERVPNDLLAKLALVAHLAERMDEMERSTAAGVPSADMDGELAALRAAQRAELAALSQQLDELGDKVTANAAAVADMRAGTASLSASLASLLSPSGGGTKPSANAASTGQVKELIAAALALYDADKTGRADFALESAGGSVISTRCSENYGKNTRRETVFGWIPLWYTSYSPRVVIQRRTNSLAPGECWAFKGSKGHLVVELSGNVLVDSVSYEHISADVAPDGHIESAPKRFMIKALQDEHDVTGVDLGRFVYSSHGKPMQTFQIHPPLTTKFIEMVVDTNHGHPEYTCLYRLRVHGKRMSHNYGSAESP